MPEVPQTMTKTAVSVTRFLHLLKGGDAKRLMAEGQLAHALGLMRGNVDNAAVDAAYAPYRAEIRKVLGAYAGTGAAVGGAAYGAHKLDESRKPKLPRTLAMLGLG